MAAGARKPLSILALLQLTLEVTRAAALVGQGSQHDEVILGKRAIPAGWSSFGCWTDNVNSRSLNQYATTASDMTPESCIAYCKTNGSPYAGVEYGNECFCGKYMATTSKNTSLSECNMGCAGDASQSCGGSNRLNVYHLDSDVASPEGPAHNAGPEKWGFLGCYVDWVANRTLPVGGQSEGGGAKLTVALCTQACQKQGYKFAGVEYAGECYCGNSLPDKYLAPDGFSGCNMVCNGNSSEFCGGPNRLDAFGFGMISTIAPKWASVGCYTDQVGGRTLRYGVGVPGGANNMTVENCQTACNSSGYPIAGVEYAQECFCDNQYNNGGGPAADGSTGCNMACKGNGKQLCGGPNRLNVYTSIFYSTTTTTTTATATPTTTATSLTTSLTTTTGASTTTTSLSGTTDSSSTTISAGNSTSTDSTTTTSANATTSDSTITTSATLTTSTAATTTTTTTTTSAAPSGLPGNWTYNGCWVDNKYGRILTQQADTRDMTPESCIKTCASKNFIIAAIEYSTQCFCGNQVVNGGAKATADSQCAMKCGGDQTQVCGGPDRMSLYSSGNFSTYDRPRAQNATLPGQWQYQGCLTDTPQPRVLPYEINMGQNLSVTNCLNLCDKFGYSAASVEYGQQCYCGDDRDRVASGVPFKDENQCNTPCPAQPDALCGGAGSMNYYTWANRNNWTQGVGDSAGKYEFLIGGPVIPLITQVVRTGKVLFTEKHGTGVGNSTGAYELDLTKLDDYDAAWHELDGLQTDVFCSAGLMLPDKGGRVVNVGGWGDDSLFGLRFYWPDGEAGVQGERGWEEDVSQVRLQTTRWYPTAMQLVNGSILVVGGERGANGPPVPNIEILPRPAGSGLLHMEWLKESDPNNLYPFLTILPSGGIAAFYWNEGRILDESSFDTVRVLPPIPGSVNRPDGGRTYPLEGTMALAPQSAPYTDPLTVILVGGSSPFQGFALDNIVTIQPENPASNWTIERMPSRRVMSCVAALPDGTFVIMNGAHTGLAGFGLATNGNLEAMLYDPSKPLYNRITRLANTTIERLYHSEAILLMDGRVLVSGSNPGDEGKHIEEYRVEIFTPPYLMGARANNRPSFTIQDKDWSYGGSYTVQITGGDVGKIALMAATSSTHGNSMAMRTIFPAFSCGGSSCTIQAPPNAHIIGGPSWHMLFVLNSAGTPSHAEWVRIGGDPAGLGNWPNVEGFSLPGV